MSVDRTKVLETAQKFLAKGQFDKAIAEYQQLVRDDPEDVRTWLKIGDLYTRKGSRREAVDTYRRVAETYAKQKFFLKAVAVYKQILKLEPSLVDVQVRLGEMYLELQLLNEAQQTFELAVEHYTAIADTQSAIAILQKIIAADAANIPVRIKLAEALSKYGKREEAAKEFEAGATLLRAQGRFDDYARVAERLLFHRTEDVALARDLAAIYLERGDPKRALGKLQICFKADPKDVGTLELLARAFLALGQLPKAVSVYREIAKYHADAGRTPDQIRALQKLRELDPGDAETRQALAAFKGNSGEPSRPEIPPDAVIDSKATSTRPMRAVAAPSEQAGSASASFERAAVRRQGSSSGSHDRSDTALDSQITRLLSECDVFSRYGLKQKVVDQLRQILKLAPSHLDARRRLIDTLLELGRIDDAAGELAGLAEVLGVTNPKEAESTLREAMELDPSRDDFRAQYKALTGVDAPAVSLRPEPPSGAADVLMIVEESSAPPSPASASGSHRIEEDIQEDPRSSESGSFTHALPDEDIEILGEEEPENAPELIPIESAPPPIFEASELTPLPSSASRSQTQAFADLEQILEEADFYIAQGLLEDARATLQDALSVFPGNLLIEDKLREVADSAQHLRLEEAPDASFSLAQKLADELGTDGEEEAQEIGSDVLDVDRVFSQFKKGVAEQVDADDSETHFDLGIAYKEMGLLDDAIAEFNLARINPRRECTAYTMIGLCFLEKNQVPEAIAHFKKGLYSETKTEREELGLYFELGSAYTAIRDAKEALFYFQKVQKRDPQFRHVADRIAALGALQPAVREAAPAIDDVDRAFDDLMGDGTDDS